MESEVAIALSVLRSEISMLRAEKDVDRQFPIWPNQRVNHFIPEASGADESLFSFKATKTTDLTATMLEGGITLGPFTRIEWASITSASTTIAVDDATATWWVWLAIDVRDDGTNSPAATWCEGDISTYWSSTVTDDEKKYTTLVPLVYITASNKATGGDPANWTIDEVKNLQCGDVYIPRL
jgi:hypothetical protein